MNDWQRLSPRMLLVHPVHEALRQLPLLISALVLGSATGNPAWTVLGLGVIVAMGLARWFTTGYRIDDDEVRLRSGLLQRNELSLPRNRIRSVQTDARLLHRLLGLTVLRIGTGQEGHGNTVFELDAVDAGEVARLRELLPAGSAPPGEAQEPMEPARPLARWQPSWLRYSPLSWSGLVTLAAAAAVLSQTGLGAVLGDSALARAGLDAAQRAGAVLTVAVVVLGVLVAAVLLAVFGSLFTYGNLVLTRSGQNLHLTHGLLRVREHSYDMRRLRGGTLREPLLVRAFGGARLDAVMTGVAGSGAASLLLPPQCPRPVAVGVLAGLIGDGELRVVDGVLRAHGPAAVRRRWTRAMLPPGVLAVVVGIAAATVGVPRWVWPVWVALVAVSAFLADDRVRALGHRVDADWLVAQQGSVERRRDCVATAGIVGWTVRQSWFQRRARVATLVAATAAGTKRYEILDVPAAQAWSVAAVASSWVADSEWAVEVDR